MKSFIDLSERGQMHRMRTLAQAALAPHHLGDVQLTLLSPIENTTFRVDTASTQRYCLRIHPLGADMATVRSELLWLAALRRDTDLVVPEPVPAREGALVTRAVVDGVPGPRVCVLFRWVDGRFVHDAQSLSLAQLGQIGRAMAQLHQHAAQWTAPTDFVRPRLDRAALWAAAWMVDEGAPNRALLADNDAATLATTVEHIAATLQRLGDGSSVFGLIHADLVPSNYLFRNGTPGIIDFDDCAWGYFLYDLALALRPFRNRADVDAARAAFLDGYRTVRPLAADHEVLLATFLAMSDVLRLGWVLQHADQVAYREWAPAFVTQSMHHVYAFVSAIARS